MFEEATSRPLLALFSTFIFFKFMCFIGGARAWVVEYLCNGAMNHGRLRNTVLEACQILLQLKINCARGNISCIRSK